MVPGRVGGRGDRVRRVESVMNFPTVTPEAIPTWFDLVASVPVFVWMLPALFLAGIATKRGNATEVKSEKALCSCESALWCIVSILTAMIFLA